MVSEQDRPKTIQIYLPFGDPRGIRVAELTTRIVRVIEVPREQLDHFAAISIQGESEERFRGRLVREGVVRIEGERIVFERDYPFSSPSSAAVALTGRTANGWIE